MKVALPLPYICIHFVSRSNMSFSEIKTNSSLKYKLILVFCCNHSFTSMKGLPNWTVNKLCVYIDINVLKNWMLILFKGSYCTRSTIGSTMFTPKYVCCALSIIIRWMVFTPAECLHSLFIWQNCLLQHCRDTSNGMPWENTHSSTTRIWHENRLPSNLWNGESRGITTSTKFCFYCYHRWNNL